MIIANLFSHVLEVSLPLESRRSNQILQQVESGQTKKNSDTVWKIAWILNPYPDGRSFFH